MNAKRTTVRGPRPNGAQAGTDEGHELAPEARAAVAAPVVTAAWSC
jgi:hypothetical protein